MIHASEREWQEMSEAQQAEIMEGHGRLHAELNEADVDFTGVRLGPADEGAVVSESVVMDGPYAETKEQLGGFYIIEAGSLEEATRWAQKIPAGTIEVRPIAD